MTLNETRISVVGDYYAKDATGRAPDHGQITMLETNCRYAIYLDVGAIPWEYSPPTLLTLRLRNPVTNTGRNLPGLTRLITQQDRYVIDGTVFDAVQINDVLANPLSSAPPSQLSWTIPKVANVSSGASPTGLANSVYVVVEKVPPDTPLYWPPAQPRKISAFVEAQILGASNSTDNFKVPAGQRWRIIGANAYLNATTVTGARCSLTASQTYAYSSAASINIGDTWNQTVIGVYTWDSRAGNTRVSGGAIAVPLPTEGLVLLPGDTLSCRLITQAGDTLNVTIALLVEADC